MHEFPDPAKCCINTGNNKIKGAKKNAGHLARRQQCLFLWGDSRAQAAFSASLADKYS